MSSARGSTSTTHLLDALGFDLLTANELSRRLGISQPTISRWIRAAGEHVVRVGRGTNTRYAQATTVFDSGFSQPLFAISAAGVVERIATLRALARGGFVVEGGAVDPWLRGEAGTGHFESLPYFLYDLRPAGFLGRQLARRLSRRLGSPPDPRDWSDNQIGRYLLEHGHDLPGNLVLGEQALEEAMSGPAHQVTDRAREYPDLAIASVRGDPPGSSAAGEQPKFVVYHRDAGAVIVKFSAKGKGAEAQRWRDLLLAERHALETLSAHGLSAAGATTFDFDGRIFLESRRFDREGERGRRPAISLAMIDAEYAGVGFGWGRAGRALHRVGLLEGEALSHLVWAELFGEWIGNSDMHLGNVSLTPAEGRFELLPLYDMLPMAFAPTRGELPVVPLRAPVRHAEERETWDETRVAAMVFWSRVAQDQAISAGFREIAKESAAWCEGLG